MTNIGTEQTGPRTIASLLKTTPTNYAVSYVGILMAKSTLWHLPPPNHEPS